MKPLAFVNATKFSDIFESAAYFYPKPCKMLPVIHSWPSEWAHAPEPPLELSSFCDVNKPGEYLCMHVQPHPHVIEWIGSNMLRINDRLSFKVVFRDDGTALIVVTHSCIIGSRWLAIVEGDSVPCP